VAFFERARATYLERARASPERFRVIDANAAIDSVRARVLEAIADLTDDG
ncbi:MAG: dTMP kinase, partial [Proteobacteria bacterium SW_6_67_9]